MNAWVEIVKIPPHRVKAGNELHMQKVCTSFLHTKSMAALTEVHVISKGVASQADNPFQPLSFRRIRGPGNLLNLSIFEAPCFLRLNKVGPYPGWESFMSA